MALKHERNFSEKNLIQILQNLNVSSGEFRVLIKNYYSTFNRNEKLTKDILFKNISILTSQEQECIFTFFNSLGKLDVFNQVSAIDNFICVNDEYYKAAKEESSKYGSLYTKLGIIIGSFIALIII